MKFYETIYKLWPVRVMREGRTPNSQMLKLWHIHGILMLTQELYH